MNTTNATYEQAEGKVTEEEEGRGGGKGVGGETTPGGLALEREKVSC